MPEPILNGSGIVSSVGQRIAAGVPEHVHMNFKRETGPPAYALD
jgi:hypothetical protein